MTGEVRKFAAISPSTVVLMGTVGEKITRTATVVPDAKEPFEILHVSALRGTDFRYSMKETEIDGKKAYEFQIENTRTSEGRYLDQITILTGNSEHNPLTIMISGNIKPAGAENQRNEKVPGTP